MGIKKYFSLNKIFNVFLRISGIGSKFLVFTLLSKHFTNIEFGNYSLITSLITIMIFILGLDFYNFSIRDILKTKSVSAITNKIFNSFLFYIAIYISFLFFGTLVFNQLEYTKPYILFILLLCITEHFSQEIYRFLIAFNKVLLANFLLFIRTAGWGIYVLFLILKKQHFTIENILKLWLFADSITIVYAILFALIKNKSPFKKIKINLKWIKKGLRISTLFFISTVFLKAIEYGNRFIVDYYLGKELAGIFTFYSSVAILITVYINTVVISFELPKLIKDVDTININSLFKSFKKSLLSQTLVISIILLIIIIPILQWQDKAAFKEHFYLLFFMIIGVGLMNFSLAYHFKLYIKHLDIKLLKVMIIAGVISILLSLIFTKYYDIYGSAFAFALSGVVLFTLRYFEAKKVKL